MNDKQEEEHAYTQRVSVVSKIQERNESNSEKEEKMNEIVE